MHRTTSETITATGTLQIRSHRRAHWFWCDNALIDTHAQVIGAIGVALYVALARYANEKTGQCWPSLVRLSRQLGINHLTARRYLQRLVDRGLIIVASRPGSTALITLLDMPGQEEAGSLRRNEVPVQGSDVVCEGTGQARSQVTRGSLPGNTEPDFPNQTKERRTSTYSNLVCDRDEEQEQAANADTTATPTSSPPRAVHPESVLPTLDDLAPATQERFGELARQSLITEGVAPWFLIRPVIEARMMALWRAQGQELVAAASRDRVQDDEENELLATAVA